MHTWADAAPGPETEVVAGGGVRVQGSCGSGLDVVDVAKGREGARGGVAGGVHVDGPIVVGGERLVGGDNSDGEGKRGGAVDILGWLVGETG